MIEVTIIENEGLSSLIVEYDNALSTFIFPP